MKLYKCLFPPTSDQMKKEFASFDIGTSGSCYSWETSPLYYFIILYIIILCCVFVYDFLRVNRVGFF